MAVTKKHLSGLSRTLCGKSIFPKAPFPVTSLIAKKFKDVTCKNCMRSWEYKQYLAGKFKEKPIKKSQTQGYLDLIRSNKNET